MWSADRAVEAGQGPEPSDGNRQKGRLDTVALLLAFAGAMLLPVPSAGATVKGDKELLQEVALLHRSNTESLVTWSGTGLWKRASKRNGFTYNGVQRLEFACDRALQASRWEQRTEAVSIIHDGQELPDPTAGLTAGLLKGDKFYEYRILEHEKDREHHNLIIRSQADARSRTTIYFNPLHHLLTDGSTPIYARLMHLYENAENPKLSEWMVRRDGEKVIVECRFGANNEHLNRYVFSLSQGGMLLKYEIAGPSLETTREYEYEEIGGVWIPRVYRYTHSDERKNGTRTESERTITWTENRVNEQLAPDEFDLAKLGVKPGDFVHDHFLGTMYTYHEGVGDPDGLSPLEVSPLPAPELPLEDNRTPQEDSGETVTGEQVTMHPRRLGALLVGILIAGAAAAGALALAHRLRCRRRASRREDGCS